MRADRQGPKQVSVFWTFNKLMVERPTFHEVGLQAMLDHGFPSKAMLVILMMLLVLDWSPIPASDVVELFAGLRMVTKCCMKRGLIVRSMDLKYTNFHDFCESPGFGPECKLARLVLI